MNERIKELLESSIIESSQWTGSKPGITITYDTLDHFAQLIVKECALTAGLMEHEGRTGIGAQILDNYGVE